jgi:pimeloyl-ACP methyl ester carboxylesterase
MAGLLGLVCVGWALVLFAAQGSLIYPAPRYITGMMLPTGVVALPYAIDQGDQTAWWLPPRSGLPPRAVWLLFGGNGARALDWVDLAPDVSADVGLLLVDYPGYGANAGRPSPDSILAGVEGAATALASHLGRSPRELAPRVGVAGHSLGAAVALAYAAKHPVRAIILLSPFTSMLAMARQTVGWPWYHVLNHRFDNLARAAEIRAKSVPPRAVVLHGEADALIPVSMGRAVAAALGAEFVALPTADHDNVIAMARERMVAELSAP